MRRGALFLVVLTCSEGASFSFEGPGPLEPLTAEEMATAVEVVKKSGRVGAEALFPYVVLDEPSKAELVGTAPIRRVAFVSIWDQRAHVYEARVDLAARAIREFRTVESGQPPVLPHEYVEIPKLVRRDPRWRKAMLARGLRDFDSVAMDVWGAGPFLDEAHRGHRMARTVSFLKGAFTNLYAHPIEVAALVDVTRGEVVEVHDSGTLFVGRQQDDFDAAAVKSEPRVAAAPKAAGAHAPKVSGHEVSWNGWQFRYALHPREGLVLYTVSHRGRSILHRAALSEMVVPYADPDANWVWRNAFDVGEYGLGRMTSPHQPGLDAPDHALLLDAVVADVEGRPLALRRAIALYERDGGILWRHEDALAEKCYGRRGAELVIQFIATLSNYDYVIAWVFRQDGSLALEADLTGIMLTKAVDPARASQAGHAHTVAPGIQAVHHQHFFNFRLDFDVDGQANSVVESQLRALPSGPGNPHGNGACIEETVLASEKNAARDVDLLTQRRWKIRGPRKNALGEPAGYLLVPGETSIPFLSPDSPVRKKARFIDHHVWVTREHAGERYAAGAYPNQGPPGEGLPAFIADDEPLENQDLVVWYTFGVTHTPRPEEWPVMPVHKTGFRILPAGFYDRNPALGPQRN